MIHGEARILLRNSLSGHIVKDITSENVFQDDLLANFIYSHGRANNSPWGNSNFWDDADNTKYISSLVGGILCFNDTIAEGSHYMPSGVNMVANGCRSQNSNSQPYEFGQFSSDAQESFITDTKVVQTWDWDNSHGNGTIKSVCLTSDTGGYIGYGNADDVIRSGDGVTFFSKQTAKADVLKWNQTYYNNKKYWAELNASGKPVLHEQPCGLTQGDLFEFAAKNQTFDSVSPNTRTSCGIPLGYTETAGVFRGYPIAHDGYDIIANNGTLTYYEFDLRNGFANATCTIKTITNTCGNPLCPVRYNSSGESWSRFIFFAGHYMVCANFNGEWEYQDVYWNIFDLSALSPYKNRIFWKNVRGLGQPAFEGQIVGNYTDDNDMILLINGENASDMKTWIYDGVLNAFKRVNFYNDSAGIWQIPKHIKGTDLLHRTQEESQSIYHNPLYLATINNLSTPVIKDASLTMKITYTLEET